MVDKEGNVVLFPIDWESAEKGGGRDEEKIRKRIKYYLRVLEDRCNKIFGNW